MYSIYVYVSWCEVTTTLVSFLDLFRQTLDKMKKRAERFGESVSNVVIKVCLRVTPVHPHCECEVCHYYPVGTCQYCRSNPVGVW